MFASGVPLPLKSLADTQVLGMTFDTASAFVTVAPAGDDALGEVAEDTVTADAVAIDVVAVVVVELEAVGLVEVASDGESPLAATFAVFGMVADIPVVDVLPPALTAPLEPLADEDSAGPPAWA